MPDHELNPFQELYVTDSADPQVFVQLFSDVPVSSAHQLFRPGNVVLKGTQGSGKSTLLCLFRPEIRLAYHGITGAKFPVPDGLSKFVAGGINLRKSGALDFGQRPLGQSERDDEALPFLFADFLNYFVVRDLLETVRIIAEHPRAFDNLVRAKHLEEFAVSLASQDCWFGALEKVRGFDELIKAVDSRINVYRKFHLFTISELSAEITDSRTNIGEPIARCADCMRESGLVNKSTPVFARIDEVDRLAHSDFVRPNLGQAYRQMINKAVGMRDARVSYRIGTRRYGWEDNLVVFGTSHKLEDLRDYRVIDLDENQRRREDTKTWIFPRFAEDALRRRVVHSGYPIDPQADVLKAIFGSSPTQATAASQYVAAPRNPARILRIYDMPNKWQSFLAELFETDPLSAVLAAAWARQKDSTHAPTRTSKDPPKGKPPWKAVYWRKERVRQALMQIAARAPHRLKWSGKEQILALSGANITVFLSICHEIWDAKYRFERAARSGKERSAEDGSIDRDVQSVGIHAASALWHQKITEQPGGNDRQRFVDLLGAKFRDWLLEDLSMSYPGRNGFSLEQPELEKHPGVVHFLNSAVAYGDLYGVPHTTKERSRRARWKWYVNPILSPYFQIPETHIKEPYYAKLAEVLEWIRLAEVMIDDESPTELSGPSRRTKGTGRSRQPRTAEDTTPNLFESRENGS